MIQNQRFKSTLLVLISGVFCINAYGQKPSTADLSFLIGQWKIERTYAPLSDQPRILKGVLHCESSLDSQFVKCTYKMLRPNKKPSIDVVYFNYNSIYGDYESLWLSSTWPIKVLMSGQLEKNEIDLKLNTRAQFQIGKGITEFVKGKLLLKQPALNANTFIRQTFIRTSEDKEHEWIHHMTETAIRDD
jgi:hypothetical protein